MAEVSGKTNLRKLSALTVGVGLSLHALYIAYAGQYTDPGYIRAGVLLSCATLMILSNPLADQMPKVNAWRLVGWLVDLALLGNLVLACSLFLRQVANTDLLIISYSTLEVVSALAAMLTIFELTRRAFGMILAMTGLLVLIYAFLGQFLPGLLRHTGFTPDIVVETIWYGFQGVFGFATGIVVLVVFIFVVFGAVLEGTGAGELMIRMALWATGLTRGGAGHAAIVASGLFGMSSGSVVANVVGTGSITIPLIRRRGFTGTFAGGLEAAASSGGQLMPPVMGASAFLMAQLVGTSYQMVCLAALIPALLFYFSLFVSVEKEARRMGIEPLSVDERPRLESRDMLMALMFILPIAAILVVLAMGRSPSLAGFWAVATTLVTGFVLKPSIRRDPQKVLIALAKGGLAGAQVMMAVGTIGVLVGVFELTGLGLSFASAVSTLTTSGLLLPLIFAAIACLILGMGMPTLPAYLIIVLVLGESIRKLGVEPITVHLFVLYFGVLSAITPPVAMASVAAAPIANAEPVRTSLSALRLALTAFLIPFYFVFEPSILLVVKPFSAPEFLWALARIMLAIWAINSALSQFQSRRLNAVERLGFAATGAGLLLHPLTIQIMACAGLCLLMIWTHFTNHIRKQGGPNNAPETS